MRTLRGTLPGMVEAAAKEALNDFLNERKTEASGLRAARCANATGRITRTLEVSVTIREVPAIPPLPKGFDFHFTPAEPD